MYWNKKVLHAIWLVSAGVGETNKSWNIIEFGRMVRHDANCYTSNSSDVPIAGMCRSMLPGCITSNGCGKNRMLLLQSVQVRQQLELALSRLDRVTDNVA